MTDKLNVIDLITATVPKDFKEKTHLYQEDYFKYVMSYIPEIDPNNDLILECGVFTGGKGSSFDYIRNQLPEGVILHGFDTFEGLPAEWKTSAGQVIFDKHTFSLPYTEPTDFVNGKFIKGLVEDTIVPFLENHIDKKIKFLHLDLDLYEPTKFVLNAVKHRFAHDTIIVLDDFYNLPGWEEFSYKAFNEIVQSLPFEVVPISTIGWNSGWASAAFQLKEKTDVVLEDVTLVTGLWDLGRGDLEGWAHREFDTYKEHFFKLLRTNVPMCIWIPRSLEEDVWKIRKKHNTKVCIKELEDFKTWFPFFDQHETIRTDPKWYSTAPWLASSPQAALQLYNPMMMTKMFMVNDTALMNPFNTKYFYWIDGGITTTVGENYIKDGNALKAIPSIYPDSIVHIAYPYEPNTEIHGFEKTAFYKECGLPLNSKEVLISRGGFWGGPKELLHKYNSLYYNILASTIASGNIGADECLFTIAAYKYPELIERFLINSNGLIYPFFEKLQNPTEFIKDLPKKPLTVQTAKNILYILGFNSPRQFESICMSINKADPLFFEKSRKILINNSTDESTFTHYDELCSVLGFEEIHKDNLGVCGGRQFVAEHFDQSDADFYMFFEDDMHLNDAQTIGQFCRNGFRKYIPNLYEMVVKIMLKEKFDFLKFSFSEFYGDNATQWAWYNVPQRVREQFWPEYNILPETGIDPNAPKTQFEEIRVINGVPYITGDVYYSNWPQIVSRDGNKKMFLDTRWNNPFEQTWMSHMYQLTKNQQLQGSVLLASTVNHERFQFYEGSLRKES